MPNIVFKKGLLDDPEYKSLSPWNRVTLYELLQICPASPDEVRHILGDREASLKALSDAGFIATNPKMIVVCWDLAKKDNTAERQARSRENKKSQTDLEFDLPEPVLRKPRGQLKESKIVPFDYELVKQLYAKHCPTLPEPTLVGNSTMSKFKARWREISVKVGNDKEKIEMFYNLFFQKVGSSDFLLGKTEPNPFTRCSLIWLMDATNFEKVVNDNYKNRG